MLVRSWKRCNEVQRMQKVQRLKMVWRLVIRWKGCKGWWEGAKGMKTDEKLQRMSRLVKKDYFCTRHTPLAPFAPRKWWIMEKTRILFYKFEPDWSVGIHNFKRASETCFADLQRMFMHVPDNELTDNQHAQMLNSHKIHISFAFN